jgi:general secretion pathway protein M
MNTATVPTSNPNARPASRLGAMTAPWRQRWQALAPRERRIAGWLGWAVALGLLWFVGVAPALRSVNSATARLDQLDGQLQQMQRLAGEATAFRASPPVGGLQAQAALKTATDALGTAGKLQLGGDRATVTFTNATGTQVRDWLAEARSAARTRPVEANLTRGPQGYSGTVIVQMPGTGSGA